MPSALPPEGPVIALAPEELARRLQGPDPPLLVDLRAPGERSLGHFPGDRAIPARAIDARTGELPRDRPVVLYDRRGESAPSVAGRLRTRGLPGVTYLLGGSERYAREVDPSLGELAGPGDGVFVAALPRPETGCLAYLIGDPVERRAIVIDPGLSPDPYLARLREGGWTLEAIVETHSHADHLAGHAALHVRTGAPVYLSRRSPAAFPHRPLAQGEELRAGDLSLQVLETPGHTVDHLTLVLGERIFTGDSLFIGGCGRTDLPGGDPELLFDTFRARYDPLPDTTQVLPAHFGPKQGLPDGFRSTLGAERATNDALKIRDRAEFVRYMTDGWPPKPTDFDRILSANLAGAAR